MTTTDKWASKTLVRLDEHDHGCLDAVQAQHPGCDRTETFRRVLRNAVLPADVLLRYRLPEGHPNHALFRDWLNWGPFSPTEALSRGETMTRKGFEVETVQVAPAKPRPAWPDDDAGDEPCPQCGEEGGGHDPGCGRFG